MAAQRLESSGRRAAVKEVVAGHRDRAAGAPPWRSRRGGGASARSRRGRAIGSRGATGVHGRAAGWSARRGPRCSREPV